MSVKLLTEHYFEFLSLKGDCIGSSESTHVKMPHCWESRVMAHLLSDLIPQVGQERSRLFLRSCSIVL